MELYEQASYTSPFSSGMSLELPGFLASERRSSPRPLAKNLPALGEKYTQLHLEYLKRRSISEVKISLSPMKMSGKGLEAGSDLSGRLRDVC